MKHHYFSAFVSFLLLGFCSEAPAQERPAPKYAGKPLSYWMERFQKSEKDEELFGAAEAIKAFGADASPAVLKLVEMLDDRSEQYRQLVGDILCAIGPAANSAVPALIRSLREKTARSPEVVISILGAIGPGAKDAVPVLVTAIEARPATWKQNVPAVEALCNIGPAAKEGIPAIRRLVLEVNGHRVQGLFEVRLSYSFLNWVPMLGSDGIALLVELLSDQNTNLQCASAEALRLAGAKSKVAVPRLTEKMQHKDPEVRVAAASALWEIGHDLTVLPVLVALAKQDKTFTGSSAAEKLGEIGPDAKSVLPELIRALTSHQGDANAILRAIEKIDPEEAKKLVQKLPPRSMIIE